MTISNFYILTNMKLFCSHIGYAATASEKKGTLHKTLNKLNNAAAKVPDVVKSINDGIEVRVENIVHPQPEPYGMVRSSVKGAANLVTSVGKEVTGFASTVRKAAVSMTKNTAGAISQTVRSSLSRLTGGRPATTTAAPAGDSGEAPSEEAATAPEELNKVTEEPAAA